jgi:hypothetical protein
MIGVAVALLIQSSKNWKYDAAVSRRQNARVLGLVMSLREWRAQGRPGAGCTRGPLANQKAGGSHRRFNRINRPSCAENRRCTGSRISIVGAGGFTAREARLGRRNGLVGLIVAHDGGEGTAAALMVAP